MPGNGDLKESFYLADPSWQKAINQEQYLPSMLDAQRDNLAEFMSACTSCSQRLLKGLACALDVSHAYTLTHTYRADYKLTATCSSKSITSQSSTMESRFIEFPGAVKRLTMILFLS